MQQKLNSIKDFVHSLEAGELGKKQEAVLFVGEENACGLGTNWGCSNGVNNNDCQNTGCSYVTNNRNCSNYSCSNYVDNDQCTGGGGSGTGGTNGSRSSEFMGFPGFDI